MDVKCLHQNQPDAYVILKTHGYEERICWKCQEALAKAEYMAHLDSQAYENTRRKKTRLV